MTVFKERIERKFQTVEDPAKFQAMLPQYAAGKTYNIKGFYEKIEVKILEFRKPDFLIIDSKRDLEGPMTFYHTFSKYMEISGEVVDKLLNSQYKFQVKNIRIATNERKSPRFQTTSDIVTVNNIRAARNTINASLFNIPTSVKIHLTQFQEQLKGYADEVKVNFFDKTEEKFELVRKSNKILMIPDTQDIMSYMPENEADFIDYREHLNTEVGEVMENYRKKKIISELIVPIIYLGHDGSSIPLGYIQLISHSEKLGIDKALELKVKAFEMVDRMRDSNTMLINKRQSVTDVSRGGMRLLISDEELKKFLQHQKGFSFDIIFKLQQPITIFSEIIYTGQTPAGELVIGVKIQGFSSRKGESDRYYQYIDALNKTP